MPDILLSLGIDYSKLKDSAAQVDSTLKKTNLPDHTKAVSEHNKTLGKTIGRVVLWGTLWTATYGIIRGGISIVKSMVSSWIDFGNAMARVGTVVSQSGTQQKALLDAMGFAALEYSRKTTVAATDVAKVMYHLGSAGLTAKESMQGYEHILSLTVGTLGNVDEISRLVASSYVLFGDSLTNVTSISEKFQYISDVLATTYAKHQVELSEIASAFGYVGGAASLVDIKFEALVGTIGFLNDGLLKGSKAGTALMQSFVSLGSKTDQLREKFGVVWDISKPIDFINIMQQLKMSIGDTAQSTIVFSQLMDVFGTRGARAIIQIIQRWDDWQKAIKMTDVEGRAKKMQEIMESTVGSALEKIKNQVKAIADTILNILEPQILDFLDKISTKLKEGELIEYAVKYGKVMISAFGMVYDIVLLTSKAMASLGWLIAQITFAPKEYKESLETIILDLERAPSGARMAATGIRSLNDALNATGKAMKTLREEQGKMAEGGISFAVAPGLSPQEQIATLKKMRSAFEEGLYERINLERMTAEEFSRQVDLLTAIGDEIKRIKEEEEGRLQNVARIGLELAQAYEVELLRARGASEYLIKQEELNNSIKIQVEYLKKTHPELDAAQVQLDVMKLSFEELAEKYRDIFSPEILADFKKGLQDITLTFETEIGDLASAFQSATTDYVKGLLSGTADIKDFLASIVDAYRTAFAESVGKMIAETGIFSGMAEAFLSPMQKARMTLHDAIVEGCRDGAPLLRAGVSGAEIPGAPGAAGGTAFGGLMTSLSSLFGISGKAEVAGMGEVVTAPPDYYKTTAAQAEKTADATTKMSQFMSTAGKAAGIAGGLYAGYQGIMAAQQVGGVQGALSGAMSGAMAGMMFGPWGAAIGGIAGGLMGLFGKKAEPPTPPPIFTKVESAIKLSNAHLEAISRNTGALNRGWEKYLSIASTSAYFAESQGVESRFLRSRMMIP